MPRWIERRGFTLRLPTSSQNAERASDAEVREGWARLSLVERMGLVRGWFNVREARAEPGHDGKDLRALSDGRALSWRWLRQPEAERLLDARLGTLRAMGYDVIDTQVSARGRWDWLYDLMHKRLARAKPEPARIEQGTALEDALTRTGLSPDAIIEGLATVLRLSAHEFAHPDARVIRRTDAAELGMLLPFLLHHEHAEIRAVGQRWLSCPSALYQLPRDVLARWLETDRGIADLISKRLRPEGLALLGPEALARLTQTGCTPPIRNAARRWLQRLA